MFEVGVEYEYTRRASVKTVTWRLVNSDLSCGRKQKGCSPTRRGVLLFFMEM